MILQTIQSSRPRFVFVLWALLLLFMSDCKTLNPFQKPDVDIKDVQVENLGFFGMDLTFILAIDNPNFIGLTIKQFHYSLLVEDKVLARGTSASSTSIKSRDVTEITIPATIEFSSISDSLSQVLEKEKINYELTGFVVIESPIGDLHFDFSDYDFHKGSLDVPRLPKLSVREIAVREWSLLNIDMEVKFHIANTNDFSFQLNSLRYLFKINDATVAKAVLDEKSAIEQAGNGEFTIPINLKVVNLRAGLLQALKQRRVRYKLLMYALIDSNRGEIKLPLKSEGNWDLLQ
jgi:LEA14-like dessication related protein